MDGLKVGDHITYVGGGRYHGDQPLKNGHTLCLGAEGVIQSMMAHAGEVRCAFGKCYVTLSVMDVRAHSESSSCSRGSSHPSKDASLSPSTFVQKLREQAAASHQSQSTCLSPLSTTRQKYRSPYLAPAPRPPAHRPGQAKVNGGRRNSTCKNAGFALLEVKKPGTAPDGKHKASREVSSPGTGLGCDLDKPHSHPCVEWGPDKHHPHSFYCPISRQCMHDPVVLTDGHTYERQHIEEWLKRNNTSPVSGALLPEKMVFPNHAMRNSIEEYFEQVLGSHRNAIRHTVAGLRRQGDFVSDAVLLKTIDSLMQCSVLMNADLCIERVLKSIMEEARTLVGAEVASVFLVDHKKEEMYSTVNSTGGEIRIPLASGIAGRVAISGKPLTIKDAYCDARFNTSVDDQTGFRTRNILCVPIKVRKHGVIGVSQLINKTQCGVMVAETVSEPEACFTIDDQHFLQLLASQAAVAITNSGMFDMDDDAKGQSSRHSSEGDSGLGELVHPLEASSACHRKEGIPKDCSSCERPKELTSSDMVLLKPVLEAAKDKWETDVLDLAELSNNRPLSVLTEHLFVCNGLVEYFSLDIRKLKRFLVQLEGGYSVDVPYHNRAHAASVLHFMHALLFPGQLARQTSRALRFSDDCERARLLTGMCGLIAAAIHDYEHLGLNNEFLVKTRNSRAIRYNDKNVNENHHVSAAFDILLRPECNFLEVLPESEYKKARCLIIELVLATDMSEHGSFMDAFKVVLSQGGSGGERFSPSSQSDSVLALQMALKCADLGHLALSWSSHIRWVKRLEEEFFAQGDSEKKIGMPEVSLLMDRDKPGVSQSQVGFFDFVVLPLFKLYVRAFPSATPMLEAVQANYKRWCEVEANPKL